MGSAIPTPAIAAPLMNCLLVIFLRKLIGTCLLYLSSSSKSDTPRNQGAEVYKCEAMSIPSPASSAISGEPDHLLVPGARRNVLAATPALITADLSLPQGAFCFVPDSGGNLPLENGELRLEHTSKYMPRHRQKVPEYKSLI
jgi:hypothetical protein